ALCRIGGSGCGARAFSVVLFGEAGHEVPRPWRERTLGESRGRLVSLPAALSTERCNGGNPVRSLPSLLPADGERPADGAGALLPGRAGGLLVVVTGAKRMLHGSATAGDMVANAGAHLVYRRADDSQKPFARWDVVPGA